MPFLMYRPCIQKVVHKTAIYHIPSPIFASGDFFFSQYFKNSDLCRGYNIPSPFTGDIWRGDIILFGKFKQEFNNVFYKTVHAASEFAIIWYGHATADIYSF